MIGAPASGLAARRLDCVRGERRVFSGVAFALPPGGALVLRGPNGSGKTSLLRIVAGFLEPAAGALLWDGRPFDDDARAGRARIAYVGHLDAVKRALTVAENLAFWAGVQGGGADPAGALDRLGIGHLAEVPARYLSAGQRRRLGLARLVVTPATLWLLDEPTVTLDDASVRAVETLIADHRAAGGAVMVATHAALALPGAAALDLGPAP